MLTDAKRTYRRRSMEDQQQQRQLASASAEPLMNLATELAATTELATTESTATESTAIERVPEATATEQATEATVNLITNSTAQPITEPMAELTAQPIAASPPKSKAKSRAKPRTKSDTKLAPELTSEPVSSQPSESAPEPVRVRTRAPKTEPMVDPSATEPRRRRWHWGRWLFALGLLVALVAFLPTILSNAAVVQWGANLAASNLKGSVTVGSASFGWLSPIELQNIEVKDAQGKPAVTLPLISGEKTLLEMLMQFSSLGKFRVERPKLELVLRDDGTNVEDMLANFLASSGTAPQSATSSSAVGLSVEVINGSITVTDQNTGMSWLAKKLNVGFEMPEGVAGPVTVSCVADLEDQKQPGKITGSLKMATGGSEAKLSVKGLPAGMFRALASRFSPGTTCDGRLSSELTATWGKEKGKNSLQANLSSETFSVASPSLQTDVVQLQRFYAGMFLSWQADRFEIERSAIDCDLGNVSLSSTIRRDGKDPYSLQSLARQRHEFTGWLDLARTAKLLPSTLHVRKSVDVTSGQVRFALTSRQSPEGVSWQGNWNADNITGTASGRPIVWQQPLTVALEAHETSDGPVVDSFVCKSDFLKMSAKGTRDAFSASLSMNLKPLTAQLGQFVDLGAIQMAGEGWGNFNWNRTPQKQFDTDGEVQLRNFQLVLPSQQPWYENNLAATFAAKGETNLDAETRIDTAVLNVKSGNDQVDAKLTQPVKDLRNGGSWVVHIETQGQLQNWPDRIAAWLAPKACRLSGAYILATDGTVSGDGVALRQVAFAAAPLSVSSPWVNIEEPRVDATLVGSWDRAKRSLRIDPGTLNCATVAMQASNIALDMPEKGPAELAGTVKYQGDVARVKQWFVPKEKAAGWQVAGKLNGTTQFQHADGVIHGETTAEISNLSVVDAAGQQFQEPQVRLVLRGNYSNQSGIAQIEQAELTSSVVAAGAGGRVAPVSGVNNLEINGQVAYDLDRLASLLRPTLGPGIQIAGRGSSAAWYRGPFELATSQGSAGFKWDAANIYGLQMGPGELKATMVNGMVQITPIDMVVCRGRMHLAPSVRLSTKPAEFILPQGPLAQQIQIDTALCGSMLKYVAPVMADVASAQGSFSVDIDSCRIPIGDLAHGEVNGRMTIHSAQVASGPMLRSLATFLDRDVPATLKRESVVQFKMIDGRVYHQGLELVFPDITIRTTGWVGLDQKMNIMAEMPVPTKWTQKNPMAAQALKNQIIRIPITGTLGKPAVDQKAVENYTRQFMQKAAGNVIQGVLDKELDRMFLQPRR